MFLHGGGETESCCVISNTILQSFVGSTGLYLRLYIFGISTHYLRGGYAETAGLSTLYFLKRERKTTWPNVQRLIIYGKYHLFKPHVTFPQNFKHALPVSLSPPLRILLPWIIRCEVSELLCKYRLLGPKSGAVTN